MKKREWLLASLAIVLIIAAFFILGIAKETIKFNRDVDIENGFWLGRL